MANLRTHLRRMMRRRPKVGMLSPGLRTGGAERCLANLTVELSKYPKDIELTGMVTVQPEEEATQAILRMVQSRMPVEFGQEAVSKLASRSDAIIYWGIKDPPNCKHPIYTAHGVTSMARWMVPPERIGHVAAVSQHVRQIYESDREVKVILNGVDPQRITSTRTREESRAALGIAPDDVVIGHIGRIAINKNILAPTLAAMELPDNFRPLYMGPIMDGVKSFKPLVREAGQRAIILQQAEYIADVYNALDVFMLASNTEGMSLSLIEAWMAGVPVVATPVGAVEELEEQYGELVVRVPVRATPTQLARAVKVALLPERKEIVAKAQELALREFTRERMGEHWRDYLLEVVR